MGNICIQSKQNFFIDISILFEEKRKHQTNGNLKNLHKTVLKDL